ncbi:hypothetical protein EAI_07335 [Harpegnathos saltator]|uniref:Uncharacterized protein n=1 Tax=Harpegnathos saltator TaxID=610380 RepID=E2BIC2_HARSA|nr:hypothetical protein EAI_07335 [Harpegnathos saltator]
MRSSKPRKRNNNDRSQRKANSKDAWRAELDATSINDDRWWCIAAIMVETTVEHSRYVSLLNEVAEGGKRTTRVCYLSRRRIATAVKTLSEKDPEKCPVAQRICHYANALLSENNGDLSTWLMARLIKYLVYRAKIECLDRSKRTTGTHRNPTIDASQQNANERTERVVWAAYVSKGKKSESTRQRAKDIPVHEPDLYVVLGGFHDPDLPVELVSVGVPLTCILQIKLPDDPGDSNVSTFPKKASSPGVYRANESELFEFWTVTNQRFSDPSAYPEYSDIAVLTFHPPILPESINGIDKKSLARDTYDEMARALRGLHHLHWQHARYLGSMKLEKRILETRSGPIDTSIYEEALSDVPNAYVDVPLILCAMLLQVESDLAGSCHDRRPVERNAELCDADTSREDASSSRERTLIYTIREKLEQLDREYELGDERTDRSPRPPDIEVVPHGDTLGIITRHTDRHMSAKLVDGVLRILRDPRITSSWRDHEPPEKSKAEMYSCHLGNIGRMFDRGRTVSRDEVAHYLHLLMFDKLIFSENKREREARRTGNETQTRTRETRPTRTATRTARRSRRSASNLPSLSTVTCSLRASRSDTAIDYGEPVVALTECPLLFALTDTRETLLPGYLYKNVFSKRRSYERPTIEEYEDVELLSSRVFSQIARECSQSFDRFAVRYFEPTDTVLLYFSNNGEAADALSEETRRPAILRTPVRFRDFCKYIAREEENWTKRETLEIGRSELTGRFMREPAAVGGDAIIFDDECFVLPGSLKARRLKEDREAREKIFETNVSREEQVQQAGETTGQMRDGAASTTGNEGGSGRADVRVTSGKASSMTGRKLASEINDVVDTSLAKKILSPRCAEQDEEGGRDGEPQDPVGYDLGRARVQLNHRAASFSLRDDIAVRVEVDDWLYGDFDLRVAVALRGCTLRLSGGRMDRRRDAFHLTTRRRGIVLAFRRDRQPGVFGAGEVLRYSVVNYDGRRYEVLNDLVVSERDRLLVRTASDYEVNEISVRRADGTDTLFRFNGDLVVTFPDGTRIISGCTIEEQPVTCEWSEDELRRYFGSAGAEERDNGVASHREDSPAASLVKQRRERPARGSIANDGFVSILLTFRMEHEDYATVSYDQSTIGCILSMPDDLRVSISPRGHYEVSMGAEVNLKVRDDSAVLSKECATCGGRSMSTFEFNEFADAAPRTILTTIDILGNLLEIKSDGATRYHRADCEHDGGVHVERGEDRRNNEKEDEEEEEEEEEKEEERAEVVNSGARFCCKHQRYCEKLGFPARSQYRIFAMNRDLTAYEYLHRSVRREQEVAAVFDDGTSMIQYPISRRPELRRLITFVPVELELRSKEISYHRQVTSAERTDYDGIELRRSTCSFPYNWLFPFGKGGRAVLSTKRRQNEVSARQNEQPLPKLLRVRVFFGIKETDGSVLIDIQRAMGRYWISVFRDGDKCRLFYATGGSRPGQVENDYESSENGLPLRELALGLKASIDVQTYVEGLQGKLIKVSTGARRQSSRLAELLRQRGSEYEEYECCKCSVLEISKY